MTHQGTSTKKIHSTGMTHNYFNHVCVEDRIMKLRKEIEEIIEAFDPFDENQKNVVRESPKLSQKVLERSSKTINLVNIERNKSFRSRSRNATHYVIDMTINKTAK